MRVSLTIVGGAVAGVIGWSGSPLTLPIAMAFPLLWAAARSRTTAAAVAGAYFLGASRGLPQGVATYFETGIVLGLGLWIVASAGFVVVHAALWSPVAGPGRAARFGLASVLMAVPPFGIVGWAHPLTAAGVLVPGWGWFGLVVTIIGMLALTTRLWAVALVVLTMAGFWSTVSWTPPAAPVGWTNVHTVLGPSLGRGADPTQHRALLEIADRARAGGATVVVLPESAFGLWTPTVARFWTQRLAALDLAVIGGAVVVDRDGYDSVLVAADGRSARIIYRQRMPVPVSMWQPWRNWIAGSGGARARPFDNPIVQVAGRRVAPLICYEQLILWPVLQSMLHAPDIIVATGNGWWSSGTSIVPIQIASAQAWARLFGRPLSLAFNY